MRRIISICKEVPLLPIAIIAAIPLALLGSWRPWEAAGVSLTSDRSIRVSGSGS